MERINRLVVEPDWYNAFSHNCTTFIRLHAADLGIERPWDWRILVNRRGEELRARSDVTDAARAAGIGQGFSALIRAGIPPPPGRP